MEEDLGIFVRLINLVEGILKAKIWRNQISIKSIKKELTFNNYKFNV